MQPFGIKNRLILDYNTELPKENAMNMGKVASRRCVMVGLPMRGCKVESVGLGSAFTSRTVTMILDLTSKPHYGVEVVALLRLCLMATIHSLKIHYDIEGEIVP